MGTTRYRLLRLFAGRLATPHHVPDGEPLPDLVDLSDDELSRIAGGQPFRAPPAPERLTPP